MLADVVSRRLEALVAEIVPGRRQVQPPIGPDPGASSPGRESPSDEEPQALGPPRRAVVGGASGVLRRGWEFGRAHVAVVAILGLVAVAWAVLGMSQARTVPVVATPVPVAAPTPSATPSPQLIQVHVVGAVARPGVVRLPVGARVGDAVEAAGGAAADARLGELNLAAVVADGAQVVIGTPAKPASEVRGDGSAGATGAAGASGAAAGAQVNLNTATIDQLDALPGVGPVTAQNILAWRAQHQRFTRVDELQEVDGIGPKTMAQLKPHVRV